jgi:hypothetical protein
MISAPILDQSVCKCMHASIGIFALAQLLLVSSTCPRLSLPRLPWSYTPPPCEASAARATRLPPTFYPEVHARCKTLDSDAPASLSGLSLVPCQIHAGRTSN